MIKRNKKNKLSFHFVVLTSSLTVIIILCLSIFAMLMTKDLVNQINYKNISINKSLATLIYTEIFTDLKNDDYDNLDKTIRSLITNRMLAYVIVEKEDLGKVVYSSEKSLENRDMDVAMYYLNTYKDDYNNESCYYIKEKIDDEIIFLGFYKNSIASIFIEKLTTNFSYLVCLFILMGILTAYFMSKIVTKPVQYLIDNVKVFAKGDFSKRLLKTDYEEIDELVESFNFMANSLQELYENLEHKVSDRTKELEIAYQKLKEAQSLMVHSEKMRSLGELVAGITHEINNPINFIYGNLIHLNGYVKALVELIEKYNMYENQLSDDSKEILQKLKEELDYAFIKEDLPSLIKSCQEGTERTKNIIADLKNFSRMEEMVISSIDIEKEIDTTLNILNSKLKNKVTIHKEYEENIPRVDAYGGQLNQVFMNIIDNSAFAIKEKGDIYIRLKKIENDVIIEFEDNGSGIEEKILEKIFDPFFTTKDPGYGTGLGLAISYKVIQRHNGTIQVSSEIGKGTKFVIRIPIERKNV